MSKIANGATRLKNARETYVEQLAQGRGITASMNRKREVFTGINPMDDAEFAYRSTPSYLRQLAQQGSIPTNEMLVAANVPRTKSASELTSTNNLTRSINGNPKYKAQEDYYEEIQSMKKDMKAIRDENSNLRAKIRRSEEDNTRKRKEIDALYDSNKDGDLRRTLTGSTTDRNNPLASTNNAANVVMSLKQRLFKLESQLKQKETVIDELRSDPRWTKGTELELQNRALLGEMERQKVARLNFIQKNDYPAALDEEKKDAVRKLTKEKDELKEENASLKKKIREMGNSGVIDVLSARSTTEKPLVEESEEFKSMKHELDQANRELKRTQTELEQVQQKHEQANEDLARMKHEKVEQANVEVEKIKRDRDGLEQKSNRISNELEEVKRDRDQCKKRLEQTDVELETTKNDRDQCKKELDAVKERLDRLQKNQRIPSPQPVPSRRPVSPPIESAIPSDELISKTNKTDSSQSLRNVAQESALKTVQASLRGHLARNEMSKTQDPPAPKHTSPRQSRSPSPLIPVPAGTGSTNSLRKLKIKSPSASQATLRNPDSSMSDPIPAGTGTRSHSPNPTDKSTRPSRASIRELDSSSKAHLSSPTDQNPSILNPISSGTGARSHSPGPIDKSTPTSRTSIRDLDSSSKAHLSSPTDQNPSIPKPISSGTGTRSHSPGPIDKSTPTSRTSIRDLDSSSKARPSSPTTKKSSTPTASSNALPHSVSSDNPTPAPRKSPAGSKQSVKAPVSDDDDDIVMT